MISVIICSVNPELLKQIKLNISSTIGVEHEFIIYNNKIDKYGIGKAYNLCSRKAKYEYCCFVHEDVSFDTDAWGKILLDFYQTDSNTGVIGFAGAKIVLKNFISWGTNTIYDRANYHEYLKSTETYKYISINPVKEIFSRVIVLDGFCLFVKKNIVCESPFDEETFKGFHLYDADFSIKISEKYHNYVNHNIKINHLSKGNYDIKYYDNLILFHDKWNSKIHHSDDIVYSKYEFLKIEIRLACALFKILSKYYGFLSSFCHIMKLNFKNYNAEFIDFIIVPSAFVAYLIKYIHKILCTNNRSIY